MNRLIIFILLLVIPSLAAVAQKNLDDSTKWNGKWDLNDPSCPCYEIQKQAEKKYEKILKKEKDPDQDIFALANMRSEIKYRKKEARKKDKEVKRNRKRKNNSGKPVCPLI